MSKDLQIIASVFITFVLIISHQSFAKWEPLSVNIKGDNFFVDTDSIYQDRGYLYYWVLTDYKSPPFYFCHSSKMKFKTDCSIKKMELISTICYEDKMGKGKAHLIKDSDEPGFHPPPDTPLGSTLIFACGY